MKELLTYALGLAGVIVTVIAVVQTLGKAKFQSVRPLLLHHLRTGPQRAEVLCATNKGTALEAVGAAIRAGALTYSRDPATLAQATVPAFDLAAGPLKLHWMKVMGTARKGLMLGGGALVLAILTDTVGALHFVVALPCAIGAGIVMLHKMDLENSLVVARAEVLPEVDRVFVEGRYQYASAS